MSDWDGRSDIPLIPTRFPSSQQSPNDLASPTRNTPLRPLRLASITHPASPITHPKPTSLDLPPSILPLSHPLQPPIAHRIEPLFLLFCSPQRISFPSAPAFQTHHRAVPIQPRRSAASDSPPASRAVSPPVVSKRETCLLPFYLLPTHRAGDSNAPCVVTPAPSESVGRARFTGRRRT